MTEDEWNFAMPEMAGDGRVVTPEEQDLLELLVPETLAVLAQSGCTCDEPDLAFCPAGPGERMSVIAQHDPSCVFGRAEEDAD